MSLLLDAIKQSDQHAQTAVDHDQAALALKQQQELTRYRRLAFSFGLLLAAILTLMAGFSIGKWLQQTKPAAEQPKLVNNSNETTESVATEAQASPETQQPAKQQQVAQSQTPQATNNPAQITAMQQGQVQQSVPQQVMQQVPVQGQQYQWVQVPVNSAPVYANQGYQVQPQYQQQAVYQNQPVYQSQPQFSQAMQQINPQQMSSNGIDLSKYKVLGKPLNGQSTQPASQSSTNDELKDVPDTLKDAFAKAVEDVDNKHSVDITRSTKNTSYAEPIELLPDALQSLIPTIKYQAHIYASETSKRWIKLNGRELYEGDNIGVLSVIEITPEQSLLSYDGYEFTLKALQDWPE
tara:strand:- start:245 stop:1297 length:1053 start_codon:yes stop_codon:yes gene_type:complete